MSHESTKINLAEEVILIHYFAVKKTVAYRVNDIPLVLKPFYFSVSFLLALFLYGWCWAVHLTCKFIWETKNTNPLEANYIYGLWHQDLPSYFVVFTRHKGKHIWMNHPSWVMKPIHLWLYFSGVKELALGSTGNSGKEALQKVVLYLKKGYNTLITPDGPAGPPRVAKHGVLQMSLESGIPVVAIRFIPGRYFTIPTWDKKRIPLPFSTMKIIYSKPFSITEENSKEMINQITAFLSEGS